MNLIVDGYCTLGTERETQLEARELLSLLDEAGIAQAVIAPEDREIAVRNQQGNERILNAARQAGGRLIPACTINPWLGEEGIRLLGDAVAHGARLLVLAPALQGFIMTDEVADPLLDAAGEMRVPVYVHTGPHSAATPTQLLLAAERLSDVRFIVGHCGSTDYGHDMPAVLRAAPDNLWFELSLVRPWMMRAWGPLADASRWVFGSSAPRNVPAYELRHLDRYWPIADHPSTYGSNLLRLLEEAGA
jgi:hypothetical protein